MDFLANPIVLKGLQMLSRNWCVQFEIVRKTWKRPLVYLHLPFSCLDKNNTSFPPSLIWHSHYTLFWMIVFNLMHPTATLTEPYAWHCAEQANLPFAARQAGLGVHPLDWPTENYQRDDIIAGGFFIAFFLTSMSKTTLDKFSSGWRFFVKRIWQNHTFLPSLLIT